jgi:hypothetical protein
MTKEFEKAGFRVQVKQLVDFQDGYGLEGEEDDEEIEEEGHGHSDCSSCESEED